MAYDYHRYYKTCLDCGSNLDHGENCDCQITDNDINLSDGWKGTRLREKHAEHLRFENSVKTHRMQKAISKVPGYDKKAELLDPEAIERLYWKLQREGKIVD